VGLACRVVAIPWTERVVVARGELTAPLAGDNQVEQLALQPPEGRHVERLDLNGLLPVVIPE
jgi:hypothetical protein